MSTYEITNEKIYEKIEEITTLTNIPKDFVDGRILYQKIFKLLNESKLKPFHEIQAWRKVGKNMMTYMETVTKGINNVCKENKRLSTMKYDRGHKKWTEEEDEILIELLCDDSLTLLDVSKTLGRSISAINTRCSVLTGVERVKQKIQGKFQGKLNGMVVDGTIDGLLFKEDNT